MYSVDLLYVLLSAFLWLKRLDFNKRQDLIFCRNKKGFIHGIIFGVLWLSEGMTSFCGQLFFIHNYIYIHKGNLILLVLRTDLSFWRKSCRNRMPWLNINVCDIPLSVSNKPADKILSSHSKLAVKQ